MHDTANLDNFGKLVFDHYKFLVDEHDFLMAREDEWTYKFENATTRVTIMMERGSNLVIEIEPIGESAKSLLRQNILPSKLGVITICLCLDQNLKYSVAKLNLIHKIIDVPVELEKQAHLLRKYCGNMLKGNFDDWPQIKDCLSKRSDEFLEMFWK